MHRLIILFVPLFLVAAEPPNSGDAQSFIHDVEARLLNLNVDSSRADWIKSTYITGDTELLAAKMDERTIAATVDFAKKATRFDRLKLDDDAARKLKLLKVSLTLATPADPAQSEELTRIVASMEGTYGKGKWCPEGKNCLD